LQRLALFARFWLWLSTSFADLPDTPERFSGRATIALCFVVGVLLVYVSDVNVNKGLGLAL